MLTWPKRAERAASVDPVVNLHTIAAEQDAELAPDAVAADAPLRFLTFNIQTGIKTTAYRHYVTKGWKHVLPHESRHKNLKRIAELVSDFDFVGLQEIDGGSLRSGFVNQVEYLAHLGQFPYWYAQLNRDLGPIAQHGNGILSRIEPQVLEDHKLPGAIPGRGAVVMRIPFAGDDLVVVMLHLSLGVRSRRRQLAYVAELVSHERQVVLMGDMNTPLSELMRDTALAKLDLRPAENVGPTYPAWSPLFALDHVLVSGNLRISEYEVLNCRLSDHRPIAVEISSREKPTLQ
jgi:endonuclease/exonuclease/phosphatase family metal-dependent hydrolase